jgi:hypothetical protein
MACSAPSPQLRNRIRLSVDALLKGLTKARLQRPRSDFAVVSTTARPICTAVRPSAFCPAVCNLRSLGGDRQDGAGHHTGAARVDLCDQASCGRHVRAWCAHSRYAKSGGRFHPRRPGVEPRRCGVGRNAKHWGGFNEALSTATTRRAVSARSRIPRKNLFQRRPKTRALVRRRAKQRCELDAEMSRSLVVASAWIGATVPR